MGERGPVRDSKAHGGALPRVGGNEEMNEVGGAEAAARISASRNGNRASREPCRVQAADEKTMFSWAMTRLLEVG
jgi:hypothetical protein